MLLGRHCCARQRSTRVLFGHCKPADGSSDHNGKGATMNSGQTPPPYVDIHFPVLWYSGDIFSVDGAEHALEMTPARRRQIFNVDMNGGYIFFDPEEFWSRMPSGPIHAVMRGWTWTNYDDTPRPRFWFVAGAYVDHRGIAYPLWWACDHVATYVTYW